MMNLLQIAGQGSWGLFFGRFHPLLVHLPIGMLMIAFILEGLSKVKRLAFLSAAVLPVMIFGALSAVLSCIAGYLLSLSGGYEDDALALHQWLGIGVAVIAVLLCVLHRMAVLKKLWFPLSGVMIVLLSAAGHYGGSLTHGDDYLTAALPGRQLPKTASITSIPDAKVYDDMVQPILEQKCYGCHNAQKLKGGLRLDGMEHIRKGGENGPVLKDSLPEASELYKRLILPENDDNRMPPKGKPQLTPQQVEILYWWIEQGASTTAKVKELQKSPRIQLVLEAMQPSGTGDHPFIPETTPGPVDDQAREALEAIGVKVMPVAAGSNYVMINCVNASGFSNKDADLLLPLKSQIVWLKLTGTQVGDSALQVLAKLPQLTRLHLEYTAVTDAGLPVLADCKQLRYLSLVGTKVSDKGVLALQRNKALRELFIYKTAVPATAISQLQQALPETRIDTGGYTMPVLATDTTVYKKEG
ncbi:c-type cytochrome domain-containing protein [Chitinophaga cymbidii]|uniref:Uncharacterized protein n=1 Tax=Chitinophaga cymbidii TaxID=1096750 RepID=A0A512RGC9_9BACT|nr:c-type cytochrome domain-containing protein [Chitinophaga cymbidii]GEP94746.1 hypothetical protein CCY01nite_10060 [Chitinophaga cymbidii]